MNIKSIIKYILLIGIIIFLLLILGIYIYRYHLHQQELKHYEEVYNSYYKYVLTNKDTNLYNKNNEIIGKISKDIPLTLEDISSNYQKDYFKVANQEFYINYQDITKSEEYVEDDLYSSYIPFNQSIVTNKDTKLYLDDDRYYIINNEEYLPIIVNDDDRYYTYFNKQIVYVLKENASVIEHENSNLEVANEIAILNYHFVISEEERSLCLSSICHLESQFRSHLAYIKENNYYTITMKDLEMFIDGKINLPKKSMAITIDDGWFVARSINLLEEYDLHATLFLIGSLASVEDYQSPNLEIHSHTWNMHNISNCPEGRSPLLCEDTNKIVEDLQKSRESLNNTTYFCYPFYDYNDHAIEALKQAGFTMALKGGNKKVTRNIDKFKVPRYVVDNTTTVTEIASMLS